MKKIAKLLMIDPDDKYLMMYRTDHPEYGNDPDLPGGTQEDGETVLETMIREVEEEAGITINAEEVREIFSGAEYSEHNSLYSLFEARVAKRPGIVMSWEHSAYTWIEKSEFIKIAKSAKDSYMHMVADTIMDSTYAKE